MMRSILRISCLLCLFVILTPCFAKDVNFSLKNLHSIDVSISGLSFAGVTHIFIDNKNQELYAIDQGNKRVVITSLSGALLYQFSFIEAGLGDASGIAVADKNIYMAGGNKVVILNYRGVYQRDMDISTIPDKDKLNIQSMALDGNNLYLGGNGRIVVMEMKTEVFITQYRDGMRSNIYIALDTDAIYIRDPAAYSIFRLTKDGKPNGRFGAVSSLDGGFSMIVDIAVDKKNGRVAVLDANRLAVIFFNREGEFLFEFGGAGMFAWPSALAIDNKGRIYIADSSHKIRVFEVILL